MSCSKYYLSLFESQIRIQHVYNVVFYNTKASLHILLWLFAANFFDTTLPYFLHSLIHNKHEGFIAESINYISGPNSLLVA